MQRQLKWALGAFGVLSAAVAVAGVKKGDSIYVKGTGVNMWAKADASGTKTPVANGTELKWQGPDDKNKSMHKVDHGKKSGFVQALNLTPNKPIDEYPTGDGKATSAAAFASSGAATKAMTEAGLKYAAGTSPSASEAAAAVIYEEGSTEAQKAKVAEHIKTSGLGAK